MKKIQCFVCISYINRKYIIFEIKDMFRQEATKANEIDYATEALQSVSEDLTKDELSVNKLVTLAKARMGLTITAKYLNDALEVTEGNQRNVHTLLRAAKTVCNEDCRWPK